MIRLSAWWRFAVLALWLSAVGCGNSENKTSFIPTAPLKGMVHFPDGVTPAAASTVVSSVGAGPVGSDGSFSINGLSNGPQLVFVVSTAGSPMLAGWLDADHPVVDIDTTAAVALYFALGISLLPDATRAQAIALIPQDPGLPAVASAIGAALATNVDALAVTNATATAALDNDVNTLMFSATAFDVLVDGGTQSGVDIIQDPPHAFHATNHFRRRAWAFADRLTYVDETDTETTAAPWTSNFEVVPTNGVQNGAFGTVNDIVNAYFGNQATAYGPVDSPVDPNTPGQHLPSDLPLIGMETTYQVTVVGPGQPTAATLALDATKANMLVEVSVRGVTLDAIVPFVANVLLGGTTNGTFQTSLGESLTADFLNEFPKIPGLMDQVGQGDWGGVMSEVAASSTLRSVILKEVERLWVLYVTHDLDPGKLSNLLNQFDVFINAVGSATQVFDSYVYSQQIKQADTADTWQLTVMPSAVTLNASVPTVSVGDMVTLTASVLGVEDLSAYSFGWHTGGLGGTLVGSAGQSGRDIACASSPSVLYLASTSGQTDTVTVEVWPGPRCQGESLGTASTTVTVQSAATCSAVNASGLLISNPVTTQSPTSNGIALRKNLDAYPNYGPTGADILYDGQAGSWAFAIPSVNIVSATVVVSMIADDHAGTPISEYSFTLNPGSGAAYPALPHGTPYNSVFGNWVPVTEPVTLPPVGCFTFTISNTSATGSTGDWIAIESIEIDIVTQ